MQRMILSERRVKKSKNTKRKKMKKAFFLSQSLSRTALLEMQTQETPEKKEKRNKEVKSRGTKKRWSIQVEESRRYKRLE